MEIVFVVETRGVVEKSVIRWGLEPVDFLNILNFYLLCSLEVHKLL